MFLIVFSMWSSVCVFLCVWVCVCWRGRWERELDYIYILIIMKEPHAQMDAVQQRGDKKSERGKN